MYYITTSIIGAVYGAVSLFRWYRYQPYPNEVLTIIDTVGWTVIGALVGGLVGPLLPICWVSLQIVNYFEYVFNSIVGS